MVSKCVDNAFIIVFKKTQAASDKALGGLMILVAAFVFCYYTVWAMLLVRGTLFSLGEK